MKRGTTKLLLFINVLIHTSVNSFTGIYREIPSVVTSDHFGIFIFSTLCFMNPCHGETTVEIRNLCEM